MKRKKFLEKRQIYKSYDEMYWALEANPGKSIREADAYIHRLRNDPKKVLTQVELQLKRLDEADEFLAKNVSLQDSNWFENENENSETR